jgi:HEPN domain-containing protein
VTKDKYFHKSYASELIAIARGDLESAEVLGAQPQKGRRENVCFAAQQAIEKSLKALLCALERPVPLTLTIELLLDRLGQGYQPPIGDALVELTDFATTRRYQEGSEIISDADIKASIDAARSTVTWAENLIRELIS